MSKDEIADLREVIAEFITESGEHLETFETGLLALEQRPGDEPLLGEVFRAIHSIKGNASFLGFGRVESVAHAGESVLGRMRGRELTLDQSLVSVLLHMVDCIRQVLLTIETEGNEGDVAVDEILTQLMPFVEAKDSVGVGVPSMGAGGEGGGRQVRAGASKIRVDITLLDRLMNLVGELVLARNQINQIVIHDKRSDVTTTAQRLNLVTTEIQEVVMKTRMQQIGNVWSRFPRVVRDLSVELSKRVRLVLDGRNTELDKSIIEALQDPLTHLVRNAVDHGIESPEERQAAGKAPEATLTLRAFHEGGMVNIVVGDDGRGIDQRKIKQHALSEKLLTEKQLGRLSDRELLNLLFLPGFSTKEGVTRLSGRGVGLDVVKTNIERLGGSVDIQNRVGQGLEVKLKIPLTLAIIPALIVTCHGERFAIPQVSLLEVVRLEGEKGRQQVESLQGAKVFRLRGRLLPLVSLRHVMGLGALSQEDSEVVNILVLQADDRPFGLLVDGILDTEEIVVKPLWKKLKGISSFAGATVMGDGRVALILDTIGLAQSSGVVGEGAVDEGVRLDLEEGQVAAKSTELVLLCRNAFGGRLAIPLSDVARLEELPRSRVEQVGIQEVVQYREEILPLVRTRNALQERRSRPRGARLKVGQDSDLLQVVIHRMGDRLVGLVVEEILDIVSTPVELQRTATRQGVLGSMVIQDRITEFLDVNEIVGRMLSAAESEEKTTHRALRRATRR